jgi:hypothetical protein
MVFGWDTEFLHSTARFCTCLHRRKIPKIVLSNKGGEVRFIVVLDTAILPDLFRVCRFGVR